MKNFISNLYKKIYEHAQRVGYPYVSYGIFQTISNPLFYLTWVYFDHQSYENLGVRIGINILCLPLALKKYWPAKWQYYLPLYWYVTALYTLPFFFTLMLLKNDFSYSWTLACLTGVVLCILLLDFISLIILLPLGIFLAWLYCYLTVDTFVILSPNYRTIIITYASVIIFGAIFSHKREKIQQDQISAMQLLSATTAHELRTPLRTISSGIASINKCLPALMKTYDEAKHEDNAVAIDPHLYKTLPTIFNNVELETRAAFTVVDMLLVKVNQLNLNATPTKICSMQYCINEALQRYPFDSGDRELVYWDNKNDFEFRGDEMLMIHVLFNLLKNSLHYIKVARKGDIQIWLETSAEKNILYFKDTGTGISAKVLPYVFDRFFTQTRHGTGIGLAFCKAVMESLGGKILCNSVEGEYAEFVLYFPHMKV